MNCPPICPPNCPPNPIFSPFCDPENGTKKALLGSIFSASSSYHLTAHLTPRLTPTCRATMSPMSGHHTRPATPWSHPNTPIFQPTPTWQLHDPRQHPAAPHKAPCRLASRRSARSATHKRKAARRAVFSGHAQRLHAVDASSV